MKRDLRIDILRGFFLVIMTIDHLGGVVKKFTWETFGFVSVAEGFVFLSGVAFAMAYHKHSSDFALIFKKASKRAFHIYWYHVVMLCLFSAIPFLTPVNEKLWHSTIAPFHEIPIKTFAAELLFLHQPAYMDILPMYFILILSAPFLLYILSQKKSLSRHLLLFSLIIWLIGQYFDPFEFLTARYFKAGKSGFFNIFSWQILFIVGIYIGFTYKDGKFQSDFLKKPQLIISCFIIALFLLLARRHFFDEMIGPILMNLTRRDDLGILRLINFSLLSYLTYLIVTKYNIIPYFKPLALLGQKSLQVFSYHVVLMYALKPVNELILKKNLWAGEIIYTFIIVASLWIPAILHTEISQKIRTKKKNLCYGLNICESSKIPNILP